MNPLTPSQKHPTHIEVDLKQNEVRFTWGDGYRSLYTLDYLRQICPCADCDTARQESTVFETPAALNLEQPAEMVGNYAMQFFWADGHNAGIYTFEFLREASKSEVQESQS